MELSANASSGIMFIYAMIFILGVYIAAAIIQVSYYSIIFRSLAYSCRPEEPATSGSRAVSVPRPVSLIICAKNEALNLKQNLPSVLTQDYPDYEVIVVNDQSTDDTAGVLAEFHDSTDLLRIIHIGEGEKNLPGKKYALKKGIENAKHDLILVTDADCRPASAQWIRHMVSRFGPDTDFVLGYSPFYPAPGLVNKMARYENLMTAMQYLSFATMGMPYMGVGRNMSFRKSIFEKWDHQNGRNISGGDDDLFVNAFAKAGNTEICLHRDAFTRSAAGRTWSLWARQKTRHVSTGKHYHLNHQAALFLFALSDFLFYITFVILCTKLFILPFVFLSFALALSVKYLVTARISYKLQQRDLNKWYLVVDPLYVVYLLIIFILTLFRPNPVWK